MVAVSQAIHSRFTDVLLIFTASTAAWHAIRENDFSIIDFTFLSPALVDLITQCMRANPLERPTMEDLVTHPILERARRLGKDALAPEDDLWLPRILANATPANAVANDMDVEMSD